MIADMKKQPISSSSSSSSSKIDRLESIPVKILKFSERDALELPGLGGQSSIRAIAAVRVVDETGAIVVDGVFHDRGHRVTAGKCWVIDFFPAIRHFRVVHYPHEGGGRAETRMVPEAHVRTWEPLDVGASGVIGGSRSTA